ncbi:unnamed protein product [Lymnaea stagnalis]|uniref:Cilia- and flagella-associated protein 299 n=1 Tax=Lymnaea stagnalis TaxID=6523 RepID=A0AAV2HI75_LYMST
MTPGGKSIVEFATYDDYLGSQVTSDDLELLEDINVARKLVQLGFRGPTEGFSEDDFNALKATFEVNKAAQSVKTVLGAGRTYEDNFVRVLQMREEGNRSGKNASILFIRTLNGKGQEVSGYIDYAHRLATEDFRPIFNLEKRLMPKPTDLSFFNWDSKIVQGMNSPNYEVIASFLSGMVFRNRRDGKMVNPDPSLNSPGDNSSKTMLHSELYLQAFVMDHFHRK